MLWYVIELGKGKSVKLAVLILAMHAFLASRMLALLKVCILMLIDL